MFFIHKAALDVKCHQPPSEHSTASSGCPDTNYSSAPTNDTSPSQAIRTLCGFNSNTTSNSQPFSNQHQQPLSSTTSNIPHSTPSTGNITGNNTNNNCNISAIGQVNGTLLSHHHHLHHHHHPPLQHLHGLGHQHPQHQHSQLIGTLPNISHHHHLHHHHLHGGNRTPPPTTTSAAVLAALCGSCCGPISDRYIMRVVDAFYHENCLQCTSCSVHLMHSCFARNGKLYCRVDYER